MYFSTVSMSELIKVAAYLDPGSSSLIIQLIIAALFGLGVVLRSQWKRIKKLFGGKPTGMDEDDEE